MNLVGVFSSQTSVRCCPVAAMLPGTSDSTPHGSWPLLSTWQLATWLIKTAIDG
jgi:hypothetical protein